MTIFNLNDKVKTKVAHIGGTRFNKGVIYPVGSIGRITRFTPDGEVYITFEDNYYASFNKQNIEKII